MTRSPRRFRASSSTGRPGKCRVSTTRNDFNCGLKSYRKEVVKSIEVYGEMHRYIPVIARWAGFRKIGEKVVEHRSCKYGDQIRLGAFHQRFLDLLSITFVSKLEKRPMHLFGSPGYDHVLIGFSLRLIWHQQIAGGLSQCPGPTDHRSSIVLYIALTAMIMGTFLFMAGFPGAHFHHRIAIATSSTSAFNPRPIPCSDEADSP